MSPLAAELRADFDRPRTPVAAFDFCTGSLTADPDPRTAFLGDLPLDVAEEVLRAAERFVLGQNRPYLRHMNLVDQGYAVVDVTPEETLVTIRNIDTSDPDAHAVDGARFRVARAPADRAPPHAAAEGLVRLMASGQLGDAASCYGPRLYVKGVPRGPYGQEGPCRWQNVNDA